MAVTTDAVGVGSSSNELDLSFKETMETSEWITV